MKAKGTILFILFIVCSIALLHENVQAEEYDDFSFIVFGDNRLPGYFPYSSDQTSDIELCFEQIQNYAFGPDVTLEYEFSFDPETGELDWFKI